MQVIDVIKYGTTDEGRHQRKKKTWAEGHMGRISLAKKRGLFHAQRLRLSKGENMIMR